MVDFKKLNELSKRRDILLRWVKDKANNIQKDIDANIPEAIALADAFTLYLKSQDSFGCIILEGAIKAYEKAQST